MKRIAVIALIILAGFCTAGSLQAQSHEVRANVPFDFNVGSKHLPAGKYTLVKDSTDNIIEIQNWDQHIATLSVTEDAGTPAGNVSQLVFNKYGDQYFLSKIQCPTVALNLEIPPSKREKQARTQMAWLGPEQTLVALY